MGGEEEPDSPCQAVKKLSVTSTKSQMATLGVTQPSDVWRNNNMPRKDQQRSQEQMRNENNSKKAWQEAVERVGQPDQSFGMKGRRTSWIRAGNAALFTHSLFPQQGQEWEKELWIPQMPWDLVLCWPEWLTNNAPQIPPETCGYCFCTKHI